MTGKGGVANRKAVMTTEVTAGPLFSSVVKEHTQHTILSLADSIQLCAAALIGLAALQAVARALAIFFRRRAPAAATEEVRIRLGRWLVLALEFQVAADILRTAATPTWTDLGQLAAVIVLRTVLNYVLRKEIAESAEREPGGEVTPPPPAGPTVPGEPSAASANENEEER